MFSGWGRFFSKEYVIKSGLLRNPNPRPISRPRTLLYILHRFDLFFLFCRWILPFDFFFQLSLPLRFDVCFLFIWTVFDKYVCQREGALLNWKLLTIIYWFRAIRFMFFKRNTKIHCYWFFCSDTILAFRFRFLFLINENRIYLHFDILLLISNLLGIRKEKKI